MAKATVSDLLATCWHALAKRFAHLAADKGATRPSRQEIRQTRKFQAVLTLLPVADGAEPPSLTWPAWRAVVRAPAHGTRAVKLSTALISADDGGPQPGPPNVVVTMVVVGPSPDDCLDIGDAFTLWRGRDIARGVISRRLYV